MGPLGTAMRVRVLHAKLYAYALPGSTARQLFNSLTLLDSSTARQNSTDLDRPRHPGTCSPASTCLDGLDSYSTATRQLLDSYSTGKALTAPRQRPRQRLDGVSTAQQLDSQGSSRVLTVGRTRSPVQGGAGSFGPGDRADATSLYCASVFAGTATVRRFTARPGGLRCRAV